MSDQDNGENGDQPPQDPNDPPPPADEPPPPPEEPTPPEPEPTPTEEPTPPPPEETAPPVEESAPPVEESTPPPDAAATAEEAVPEEQQITPPPATEPAPSPSKVLETEEAKAEGEDAKRTSKFRRSFGESVSSMEELLEEEDEEGKTQEGKETDQRPSQTETSTKKRKQSLSTHLQAKIIKQKLAQAKEAREQRRGNLEAQQYFLIEQVARHTDLKEKEVEEFIIDSQNYCDLLDKFLDKEGPKAVVFSYQLTDPPGPDSGRPLLVGAAKKEKIMRLLVSDGSDIALKGTCMFFIRFANEHKSNIKTINEEIYFGVLDIRDSDEPGFVLQTVCSCLRKTFLKYLKINNTWVTIQDPETAAAVRHKFITSIGHYAEFLEDCRNDIISRLDLTTVCDMDEIFEKYLKTADDVMESSRNHEVVAKIEHTVIVWCKNIEKVLALSKQMRKETDTMGPLAELAYWRNLMGKMCFIIQQVQQDKFMNFIQCLLQSKSRVLRRWKDVDGRVTDEFHEAKDNVRYMYALEKFCEPVYQNDPGSMIPHINSMMYTIRTIHTTSRYYNSCEKVTALMVKISNQMVASCRQYLTNNGGESVWNQDKSIVIGKLNKCLELYATYRGSYESTKAELEEKPEGKQFNFSVNHIFGRFDHFCERMKKIIQIVEIFDMYKFVHLSHIDGLDEISTGLNDLYNSILKNEYDPLEFREDDFDNDFVIIRNSIDEIQKSLEIFMDKSIENCPTAMHGVQLLERFRNLRNRCLDIEGKEWYLFQFYNNEITLLKNVYEAEKNDTPTPRGFPPFSGKIAWSRHLYKRLERPMNHFKTKTKVLDRDDSRPMIKNFNSVSKKLVFYELLLHDAFCKQCPSIYDSLEAPLLTMRGTIRQELVLNFDPFFRQIVEETEILKKLELEVPEIAQIVYFRQHKLFEIYEQVKALLERFVAIKARVPNDLALLIRPMVKKVEKSFLPGTSSINWTSSKCEEYFEFIKIHLNELEEITLKINDIISVRINQFLNDVAHTLMVDFPDERPMYFPEFMERIKNYGRVVAKDLEYKSRACEAAVIELINTLLNAGEFDIPDELLYCWLNEGLFEVSFQQTGGEKGRKDDSGLAQMVQTLSQPQKEELKSLHEECRHVFLIYGQKFIEALQKTTRISLDILRRRTEEPQVSKRNPQKIENRVPLFLTDLVVAIPTITIKPSLEDLQVVLKTGVQNIVDILKHVIIWGQNRRTSFDATAEKEDTFYKDQIKDQKKLAEMQTYQRLQAHEQILRASIQIESVNEKLKNCFKPVIDYKGISKMVLLMQSVVTQSKLKVNQIITDSMKYDYLWSETREDEIKKILENDLSITEVEALMRTYKALDDEINGLPATYRVGPLDITTHEMKLGLVLEIKQLRNILCKLLNEEYRIKSYEIAKFIDESSKDLNLTIRDMNDMKFVVGVLDKVRDKFVEHEMALRPIKEIYDFLFVQGRKVHEEESTRVDALRDNFDKLQVKALEVQAKICSVQGSNRQKLNESVVKFRRDVKSYMDRYKTAGPMVDGIAPQEASDRLILFQYEYDELWERYNMCNAGEILFGLPTTPYPELFRLQKELALLQKLYGLYNDIVRSISGYYEIRWVELDIPKINIELAEFLKRCDRLPKALKSWPAFQEMKKRIQDFSELCPLLELMTNKSMRERHWLHMGEIMNFKFDSENENFTLKAVMKAPLTKFKTEIEGVCNGAIKEEIDSKTKSAAPKSFI